MYRLYAENRFAQHSSTALSVEDLWRALVDFREHFGDEEGALRASQLAQELRAALDDDRSEREAPPTACRGEERDAAADSGDEDGWGGGQSDGEDKPPAKRGNDASAVRCLLRARR